MVNRQFYFYLLPADVTELLDTLKTRLGVRLLQSSSATASAVDLESPNLSLSGIRGNHIDCYITRTDMDVRMRYVSTRAVCLVADESEVVQFSGCEFDGQLLVRGRFYFQTDVLTGGTIVPKKKEFIDWANRLFRLAKNNLRYSRSLHAYVGQHADKWKGDGGRFVWMVTLERGPLYAEE